MGSITGQEMSCAGLDGRPENRAIFLREAILLGTVRRIRLGHHFDGAKQLHEAIVLTAIREVASSFLSRVPRGDQLDPVEPP